MRTIAWFSCGAASAVAAKLAVEDRDNVEVVYCDTMIDEHPDNQRFFDDVQVWIGQPITRLKPKYASIEDVFEKTRYMSGIYGARCTVSQKKQPRFDYQRPDDVHIFGLTADEGGRIAKFEQNNHDLHLEWNLQSAGMTKAMCHKAIEQAGIDLPAMYGGQGVGPFKNNNCLGCVKATSAKYWNQIRKDFPDVFERRAKQSRELGVRLTRVKGERVFLDELPTDYLAGGMENISCGPDCQGDLFR
jgi:hypothetical protein